MAVLVNTKLCYTDLYCINSAATDVVTLSMLIKLKQEVTLTVTLCSLLAAINLIFISLEYIVITQDNSGQLRGNTIVIIILKCQ